MTLGDHFDCPMTSSKDMVECLRKIPTEKLHEAHVDLYFHWHKDSTERSPMNVFSPRSDPEAGPESFLPHHPHVAMKRGTHYIFCPYISQTCSCRLLHLKYLLQFTFQRKT